ncbi:MAG: DUF1684 domain-containing protein [Bacteroidia bacterium]|nr:DUF1684 domain-containing protein [Bacteroidia bacterium]
MDINNRKSSTYITAAIGVVFFGILLVQFLFFENPSDYDVTVQNLRIQKDSQFAKSTESPITEPQKFKGLSYFPPTEAYKVQASFKAYPSGDTLFMRTTSNEIQKMIRVGKIQFQLFKHDYELSAYKPTGSGESRYFIPFKDMTNGLSTYGGGRYLDVEIKNPSSFMLDFNFAYNPYCVYNEKYSCPLPPAENMLSIELFAGEKMYKAD